MQSYFRNKRQLLQLFILLFAQAFSFRYINSLRLKVTCKSNNILYASQPQNEEPTKSRWPLGRFIKTLFFFRKKEDSSTLPSKIVGTVKKFLGKEIEKKPTIARGMEKTEYILVVGGTGGVGKRVIESLIRQGIYVRTNEQKAYAFFQDPQNERVDKHLDIIVADVRNITVEDSEIFRNVVACVFCHAAVVQPKGGDGPDRAK